MAAPRRAWDVLLRMTLWLVLGGWVGVWLFFGAVVSRIAFTVLPSTEVAGTLIGPVLGSLHLFGAAAGPALAGLTLALRRGLRLATLPLLMGGVCAFSHIVVTAEISELQELTSGPDWSQEIEARFRFLHQLSVGLYVGVGIAAVGLAALHARADSHDAHVG